MSTAFTFREGSDFQLDTKARVARFNGVLAIDYLNPRRPVALVLPNHDVEIKAGSTYKIYTGIGFGTPFAPDIRVVESVFKETGLTVVRVAFEAAPNGGNELIVFVRTEVQYKFDRLAPIFESFRIFEETGQITKLEPLGPAGFVPAATRTVQDAGKRSAIGSPREVEPNDDDMRRKFDEFLQTEDKKAGQVIIPGGAPAAIQLNTNRENPLNTTGG